MNGRERILAVLRGEAPDRLPLMPITMQFAAAQVGVNYRRYATDYTTLAAAQVHTARKFGFDYVSCISDPAREAADCGAEIVFFEDQPPAFREQEALLADKARLARLRIPDPFGGGRMTDRVRGVALLSEQVAGEKMVEGWVEGPIAQAADLRGISRIMLDFFDDPQFVRDLFGFVIALELKFALAQLEAGAEIIGIGDAAASLAGPAIYNEFIWPEEKKLVDAIHSAGGLVRLHICGNTGKILEGIGRLGCDIVDVDYFVSMKDARAGTGGNQVLLGNINPVATLRDGSPDEICRSLAECRAAAGNKYIVGAGCEVPRDTPEQNLQALCDFAGHALLTG